MWFCTCPLYKHTELSENLKKQTYQRKKKEWLSLHLSIPFLPHATELFWLQSTAIWWEMIKSDAIPNRRKGNQFPAESSRRDLSTTKAGFARVCFLFLESAIYVPHWNCRRKLESSLWILKYVSNMKTLQVFSLSEATCCFIGVNQNFSPFSTRLQRITKPSLPFSGMVKVVLPSFCAPAVALLVPGQMMVVTSHGSRNTTRQKSRCRSAGPWEFRWHFPWHAFKRSLQSNTFLTVLPYFNIIFL